MSTVYIGTQTSTRDWRVHVERDGVIKPLDPGYCHGVNHSPTGFAWGYGGSGPAQLAFAILADCFGPSVARHRYQDFKWRVISKLSQSESWRLTAEQVAELAFVAERSK